MSREGWPARTACWGCAKKGHYRQCDRCGVVLCNECAELNPTLRVRPCPVQLCPSQVCEDTCHWCGDHRDAALAAIEGDEKERALAEADAKAPLSRDPRERAMQTALNFIRAESDEPGNKNDFVSRIGDMIFLLRAPALRLKPGLVQRTALRLAQLYVQQFNAFHLEGLVGYDDPMNWAECFHARAEVNPKGRNGSKQIVAKKLAQSLAECKIADVLRYAPREHKTPPVDECPYCVHCGAFREEEVCDVCGRETTHVVDYDAISNGMVWCSIFHDLGIPEVKFRDGSATVDDALAHVAALRPWKPVEELGFDAFLLQGYLITHLVFVMSAWGAFRLTGDAFAIERKYIQNQMRVAVEHEHVDLVGEFVYSLRILGEDDAAIALGTDFLVKTHRAAEASKTSMFPQKEFHGRFHAAYCVLLGLGEWQFGPAPQQLPYKLQ